jgi:hypothetical protein
MRNSGDATIPGVSAAELKFAIAVACAAVAMKGPYPTPSKPQFTTQDANTGELTTYRFANSAVARGGFAVMREFDQEPAKGIAVLMRWSELMRLIHDQRMRPYVREAPDGSGAIDLCPEVLEVAAELPLDGDRGFDAGTFFRSLHGRITSTRQAPLPDARAGAVSGQSGFRSKPQQDGATCRYAGLLRGDATTTQPSATK